MKYAVLYIFIPILSGCITTRYTVATHKQDIFFYSTEKEVAIGRNIAKQIASEFKISKDPKEVERVNRIGSKVAAVCDRKDIHYYFYVIDDKDEFNAFSIPGGYVYIYKKLMDSLDDDELAFVLAHEIGHIVARHAIKRLQAAMGMNLLMIASTQANAEPGFREGLYFALANITMAYSRDDEFTADELGTKYIKTAGFKPTAGIEVLNKLYTNQKKQPLHEYSYFRTHPYAIQRITHIKKYLGLPLDINDYIN